MGMLDRYKKSGGLKELIKLLESSDDQKRDKLLQMIRAEDAAFAEGVERKLLSWEKIVALNPDILAEIVSSVPAQFLSRALFGENEGFVKTCEKCIKNFSEYKEAKQVLTDAPPNPAQVAAARRKVMEEARKLEEAGSVKFDESPTAGGTTPAPASSAAAPQVATSPTTTVISNKGGAPKDTLPADQNTPPPRTAFSIEDPPTGLTGEQLNLFFKKNLGIA